MLLMGRKLSFTDLQNEGPSHLENTVINSVPFQTSQSVSTGAYWTGGIISDDLPDSGMYTEDAIEPPVSTPIDGDLYVEETPVSHEGTYELVENYTPVQKAKLDQKTIIIFVIFVFAYLILTMWEGVLTEAITYFNNGPLSFKQGIIYASIATVLLIFATKAAGVSLSTIERDIV